MIRFIYSLGREIKRLLQGVRASQQGVVYFGHPSMRSLCVYWKLNIDLFAVCGANQRPSGLSHANVASLSLKGSKKMCITNKIRVKIVCVGASLWRAPFSLSALETFAELIPTAMQRVGSHHW
jgi:hypothetical protein